MKHRISRSNARRQLIKRGAQSASAAALVTALLPTRWQKPIVNTVLLPAHAQMSPGSGGSGGGTTSLRDPCNVTLVSGDTTTNLVEIRVTGSVIPATGGLTVSINAVATPTGSTAGPIDVVTALDGTYISSAIGLTGPGITLVDVTVTLGTSTTTCQLDVVAASGGSGSGGGITV